MKRHGGSCAGIGCAAFGAGMLAATIFPPEWMLILAAAALVLVGCTRVKCR